MKHLNHRERIKKKENENEGQLTNQRTTEYKDDSIDSLAVTYEGPKVIDLDNFIIFNELKKCQDPYISNVNLRAYISKIGYNPESLHKISRRSNESCCRYK